MKLRFAQVDAFADSPFSGNPAAVMPLDAWLDDATLLAIAAENGLPETAFLVPDAAGADYMLRWFSPAAEVRRCGHATLASGHHVLGERTDLDAVRFRTRHAGVLRVARAGRGYALSLPAMPAAAAELPEVVAALGGEPVATLWEPRGYAVLVYAHEDEVRALRPDFAALSAQGDRQFIVTAPGTASDVVSRVFTPASGIAEDQVTGSAHAVIAPYWEARLGRDRFTAVQASPRGGRLTCRIAGDRVVLEGGCVTVIEGWFTL